MFLFLDKHDCRISIFFKSATQIKQVHTRKRLRPPHSYVILPPPTPQRLSPLCFWPAESPKKETNFYALSVQKAPHNLAQKRSKSQNITRESLVDLVTTWAEIYTLRHAFWFHKDKNTHTHDGGGGGRAALRSRNRMDAKQLTRDSRSVFKGFRPRRISMMVADFQLCVCVWLNKQSQMTQV